MKTIIKMTLATLALVVGASASQAQPVVEWHFPYKGAPYGVWVEPDQKATSIQLVRTAKHRHHAVGVRTVSKKQVSR